MITQEKLQELFDYKDGSLYRKVTVSNNAKVGDKAGSIKDKGYTYIRLEGKDYLLHRLIYLHQLGVLPEYIDHIDTNKSNNRINNLRSCTLSENKMNTPCQPNNKSGTRGVHFCNRSKTWIAKIKLKGKSKYIMASKSKKDAIKARTAAEKYYFGDFMYNV
tara:strand:+ start:1055 stop:1537 length:483 start_codon:yes stop_codon:yes gene_type:complete